MFGNSQNLEECSEVRNHLRSYLFIFPRSLNNLFFQPQSFTYTRTPAHKVFRKIKWEDYLRTQNMENYSVSGSKVKVVVIRKTEVDGRPVQNPESYEEVHESENSYTEEHKGVNINPGVEVSREVDDPRGYDDRLTNQ
jgi:hypothetical protein